MRVEIQQWQNAARLFVDNDLGAYAGHDVLQGLDVDAEARNNRGLDVFRQQGTEPSDIAFRFIDPLEPVALGLADPLILLALGQRDHLVVIAPSFVDQLLFLLLGLVDLVERRLHRFGRIDVLQLHLIDADPHCVFGRERLHLGQRLRFDFLSADGNHLVHGAIADDLLHDGFGKSAEGSPRFSNVEKEFDGIGDTVLNYPFHQYGVQVTRHHLRFSLAVTGNLIRISGARSREPEFLLQLPFDGNDGRDINAQRQLEMQSRRNVLEILTEPLHDSDRVAWHSVIGRPCDQTDQGKGGKEDYRSQATTRQYLLQSILPLPDQILNIGTGFGP